jgi:hypothetical protein
LARLPEPTGLLLNRDFRPDKELSYPLHPPASFIPHCRRLSERLLMTRVWRGVRCAWPPFEVEKGCGQSTPQTPHIQGVRNPPDRKIASAAVITTRSNRALSRLKSTTETKSSASTRILVTLVIVVINSSHRSRHASIAESHCCQLHTFHPGLMHRDLRTLAWFISFQQK